MTLNYFEVTCTGCNTILPQGINLNYHDLTVAVGGTVRMIASLQPPETTNKTIFWSTPNDSVVYLGQDGTLTALQEGTTSVVAESESRGLTDTCRVEVISGSAYIPGINFEYFEGEWDMTPDFASMDPVFTGTANNFDISPAALEDYFGFRFYGEISIENEGTYNFYTASDDGSMLYIDGSLVVDNDGAHATVEQGGTIVLDSGHHQIEVLFFEIAGGAVLEVYYEGPGIDKAAIPDSILGTYIVGGELVSLEGITMPETLTLALGGRSMIPVAFTPANASDKMLMFDSSDPAVATVNRYDYLEGLTTGTTTITATSRDGGFSGETVVTVVNDAPVVEILSPDDGALFADTATVQVRFAASDTIGGIASVALYLNGAEEQRLGGFADQFDLDPLAEGVYDLQVEAADVYGMTGRSNTISVTVEHLATPVEEPGVEGVWITAMPNPFEHIIQFRINLTGAGELTMKVYDLKGSLRHISGPHFLKPGRSVIRWDGTGRENQPLPAGSYLCRFSLDTGEEHAEVLRMVIKK